ncbi:hypothetical protein [Sphingobacterium siyangense]|uniref:hypothetical protein n=1 Tax=Sphingobacterium siyangense TaxID=459529 RepID=UPI002FD8A935
MENLNINLKCVAAAVIILLFTYFYYNGKSQVTFLSLGTAVFFWAITLATVVIAALAIRILVKFAISGVLYPNFFFYLVIPFLLLLFLGWILYGIVELPMAESLASFMGSVKNFIARHLPYIAGLSIIIAMAIWTIARNNASETASSFSANINFVVASVLAILLVSVILYQSKKIGQPPLPEKFSTYNLLGSPILEGQYEITLLLESDGQNIAARPLFISEKKHVVINVNYLSSNKNAPLYKSYKIGSTGSIIDSLNASELSTDGNSLLFEKGYLRPEGSENRYSWIFDGDRTPLVMAAHKDFSTDVTELSPDSTLMLEYFHRTAKLKDGEESNDHWRGTNYYSITTKSDTIRFRLEDQNSRPVLEYYPCPEMDFGLLRLNGKSYYIIKQRH